MKAMELCIQRARQTMNDNIGGPFGAAIVDAAGQVVAVASNLVLGTHDPTAHAEINAIRKACRVLETHDLGGCTLYASSYPCPMCLGAIMWANIRTVYYGCRPQDAAAIGFRDDFMYEFIRGNCQDAAVLHLEEMRREDCLELFKEYTAMEKEIY
ncbi:MAG: nucleoside deaminase [Eubacteriales bacterium]|nr:nucleoside deaminase [Eubacteriales bacterium]